MLLQLPVYDASKAQLLAHGVKDGAGCHLAARWAFLDFWTHLQCLKLFELFPLLIIIFSFLAGLSACIASNPVDVVRTRMMVQRKTARYDLHQKKLPNYLLQVEAVLACQCRVPMERQCLTPTSHPPCDVDYTRYSLLPETRNWKHQHRCGLRDLWPFTRAFFRHLQGWDRGMSSSSLFMRNSRIPIHMLADEITNIISIQYSCILGFRMST